MNDYTVVTVPAGPATLTDAWGLQTEIATLRKRLKAKQAELDAILDDHIKRGVLTEGQFELEVLPAFVTEVADEDLERDHPEALRRASKVVLKELERLLGQEVYSRYVHRVQQGTRTNLRYIPKAGVTDNGGCLHQ
jgi:hypothetical protein